MKMPTTMATFCRDCGETVIIAVEYLPLKTGQFSVRVDASALNAHRCYENGSAPPTGEQTGLSGRLSQGGRAL